MYIKIYCYVCIKVNMDAVEQEIKRFREQGARPKMLKRFG